MRGVSLILALAAAAAGSFAEAQEIGPPLSPILAAAAPALQEVGSIALRPALPSTQFSNGFGDFDLAQAGQAAGADSSAEAGGPSPRRAFLYSALVPGAGEYYAGAKRKAAVFFGLEVLAWSLYAIWDGKGKEIEDEFRGTADEHFNPNDYVTWRITNTSDKTPITHDLPCKNYIDIYRPRGSNRATGEFGDCPGSEVQQYYELIGKYDQFVAGWSDLRDATGNLTQPVQVDSAKNFDSDIRQAYEDRRDDSNRYLKRAITVAGLALINHVFSAIDAGRTAGRAGAARDRSDEIQQARLLGQTRLLVALQPRGRDTVPMLMALRRF